MKTMNMLLSLLMAIIIASCATTAQLKETPPCTGKTEVSYQPEQTTILDVNINTCFKDTVLPQKTTKLENGHYAGVLATTTKALYTRQLNTVCDFEGEQELTIFKEVKDKDFEIRGNIGASITGTLLLLKKNEGTSKEDSLQQSNAPKEVLAEYDYVAVYTTKERSEKHFKGELFSLHATLCYPQGYTKNCLSKKGTGKVRTIFTPSKAESKDVCLQEEIISLERKMRDSTTYYQENVTLKGTYRELQRIKEVQQATTTPKGITITGPTENVREFALKHWRIDYEKTDHYEKSAIWEENWLRGTYFYDVQKQTLFIDEDANGKWEYAVVNGKKMTPEEYNEFLQKNN